MKIGVFVGSFDPIHIGHINVMDYLIDNKYLEKIIILPILNYLDKKKLTDIKKREEMLKLIDRDYLIVDNIHNKYEYTYEIMEALNKEYKNDELFLIISADNILDFDKWKNVNLLLENNKVIVLNRNNIDILKYVEKFKNKKRFIIIQNYPFINISSTELRRKINKKYLDEKVYRYVIENKLYSGEDD